MMERATPGFRDDLPEMEPVISWERTDYGWRALTDHGEVLEVRGRNGSKPEVPSSMVVFAGDKAIGRRRVINELGVDIDAYLGHFNRAIELYKRNEISDAVAHADLAALAAPTKLARFNRAMILLAAGRWNEGLHEYWDCELTKPFMRPEVERAISQGLRPWRGEPLTGKRVLLLHAHGFGDTIMMLRYVPELRRAIMVMPPELHALAGQCGVVVYEPLDCDFFCPMLHLLYMLRVTPQSVLGEPYLHPPLSAVEKWRRQLGPKRRRRIGLAWSVGKPFDGDYPRQIDPNLLIEALGEDDELHSVQTQCVDDDRIIHHRLEDFSDCAGLMMGMDEIVSVDTAALHLAGAIGHPCVTGLLSYWSSWRWQARWYNNVKLCRQISDGDWASALAQR